MTEQDTEELPRCLRCGDPPNGNVDGRLCESCLKTIQRKKIVDGVRCEACDGYGRVYGTWCDVQRAMNGRDTVCSDCAGSGRVEWEPNLEDVHPALRQEVLVRGESY